MRRQWRSSRSSFCAAHEMIPPEWFAAQGCAAGTFDSRTNIIATNANLQALPRNEQ
jgi:hypothetical protein